jgi:hypothetical protein
MPAPHFFHARCRSSHSLAASSMMSDAVRSRPSAACLIARMTSGSMVVRNCRLSPGGGRLRTGAAATLSNYLSLKPCALPAPVLGRRCTIEPHLNSPLPDEGESHKKARPVAAIHYRKRSDSFQSRHKAGAGNRRAAMASCRSKVRVAVRALVKRRERTRRRVRRRTLSAHR